jgi:hypothetical protein
MTSLPDDKDFEYSMLVHLFLELRGRGMSLSSADLDILKSWEDSGIKPEFIAQIMIEYAEDCKQRSKHFPNSFLPLSRRVRSILIKANET